MTSSQQKSSHLKTVRSIGSVRKDGEQRLRLCQHGELRPGCYLRRSLVFELRSRLIKAMCASAVTSKIYPLFFTLQMYECKKDYFPFHPQSICPCRSGSLTPSISRSSCEQCESNNAIVYDKVFFRRFCTTWRSLFRSFTKQLHEKRSNCPAKAKSNQSRYPKEAT